MEKHRLLEIEKYVVNYFQEQQQSRILAKDLFDSTTAYANADIVRALEALEKTSVCWCGTQARETITSP